MYTNKGKEIEKIKAYKGIMELIKNGKTHIALTALEDYLKKYPGNSYGIKEYATILRHYNRVEEALEMLPEDSSDIHLIRERAICFLYLGNYEKALKEINKLPKNTTENHFIKTLCKVKLGLVSTDRIDPKQAYRISQAVSYSRENAIIHIKEHTKEAGRSYFNEEVDIEKLYDDIDRLIPKAEPQLSIDPFMTGYLFYVPRVGFNSNDIPLNHLKVATILNTGKILTMFPTEKVYLTVTNDYPKMMQEAVPVYQKQKRRESQIDKFNRKYGIK